jgi:LytS/YehU family sensor histidine kinase
MYVIIPAFLYTGDLFFLLSFTGLIISNFAVATLMAKLYIHTTILIHNNQVEYGQYKYYAVANGIWIPLILLSLVCGILLSKKWMLQQTANEILIKEKISKELKLLKTRIHPRFLFHSLNSLEGKLRNELPESPNLILKMSELLSYVLFGSEGDYVLLEKELEVIREYMICKK